MILLLKMWIKAIFFVVISPDPQWQKLIWHIYKPEFFVLHVLVDAHSLGSFRDYFSSQTPAE